MSIELNKVTWYSKFLALILFIALPFIGFWLGMQYANQRAEILKWRDFAKEQRAENSVMDGAVSGKYFEVESMLSGEITAYLIDSSGDREEVYKQQGSRSSLHTGTTIPAVSPSGQKIAIVDQSDHGKTLLIRDVDGRSVLVTRELADLGAENHDVVAEILGWSPDDGKLLYTLNDSMPCAGLYPVENCFSAGVPDEIKLGFYVFDVRDQKSTYLFNHSFDKSYLGWATNDSLIFYLKQNDVTEYDLNTNSFKLSERFGPVGSKHYYFSYAGESIEGHVTLENINQNTSGDNVSQVRIYDENGEYKVIASGAWTEIQPSTVSVSRDGRYVYYGKAVGPVNFKVVHNYRYDTETGSTEKLTSSIPKFDWKIVFSNLDFIKAYTTDPLSDGWNVARNNGLEVLLIKGVSKGSELDEIRVQFVKDSTITDTDAKFGSVTYFYDEGAERWMESKRVDGGLKTAPAEALFMVDGFPVFKGVSRWLTYIVPLDRDRILKVTITGSGETKPLDQLIRSIKRY